MLRNLRVGRIAMVLVAGLLWAGVAPSQSSGISGGARDGVNWYQDYGQGRAEYEEGRTAEAMATLEYAKEKASQQNAAELDKARILDTLGAAYEAEGKLEAAKTAFDQGLAIRRQQLPEASEDIAISLTNESSISWAMAKADEAILYAKQAKAMWETIGKTDRKEYAVTVNNLLAAYRLQGRMIDATPLIQAAREIYRRTLSETDPLLPQSLCSLAAVYKTAGDYRAADSVLAEALQLPAASSGTQLALRANLLSSAGDLKLVEGQLNEAEKLLREALSLRVSGSDTHLILRAATYRSLGAVHRQQGRLSLAQQDLEEALKLLEGRKGLAEAERGVLFNQLGMVAVDRKQSKEAEQWFRRSIVTLETSFGQNHPNASSAYSNLAVLYIAQHHFGKAEQIFRDLFEADKAVLPPDHPDIARDLNNLGSLAFRRHRYEQAESQFREAASIFERALSAQHPETAITQANLANALSRLKRPDEARDQYVRAVRTLETFWGQDSPRLTDLLVNYENFCRDQKDSAIAEQLQTRIERIRVKQAIAAERDPRKS